MDGKSLSASIGVTLVAAALVSACSDDAGGVAGAGGSGASSGGSGAASGTGGSGGTTQQPTCAEVAAAKGWAQAFCEWNANDACDGVGDPTSDCDHCCPAPGSSGGTGGSVGGSGGGGAGGSGGSGSGGIGGTGGSGGTGGGATTGFGFPVGDKSTPPAGGWMVWQMLGHYWSAYGGRHLAQDVSVSGGVGAVNAPVYSVADGTVLYAKPNGSSYKNVLMIEHDVGDGTKVCSFYGHINPAIVGAGDKVVRGQQVATIKDWAECASGGASSNTHLHYVLVTEALCQKAKAWNSICGYDNGGDNGLPRSDTSQEPYYYTAVNDDCGAYTVTDGFISPTKFISDHHY